MPELNKYLKYHQMGNELHLKKTVKVASIRRHWYRKGEQDQWRHLRIVGRTRNVVEKDDREMNRNLNMKSTKKKQKMRSRRMNMKSRKS